MRKTLLTSLMVAGAALGLMAPAAASAAQPKVMIREFYPGATANNSYIVLQAYAPNQTAFAGRHISWVTALPTGLSTPHSYTFPTNTTNTANQATILIADDGYTGTPAPDFVVPDLTLYPGGGTICVDCEYNESIPDYVGSDGINWGGGGGAGQGEGGVSGYPAFQLGGVPPGKAGRRSIGLGCPTLLEASDRSGQGQSDFFSTPLNPRNNASPIIETPCSPPHTGINSATVDNGGTTSDTSVRIAFSTSKLADSTFECKLDGGAFEPCVSPKEYTGLAVASHKFEVRATNANGTELTPASMTWTVAAPSSLLSATAASAAAATAAAPAAAPAAQAAPAQRASVKKKAKKRRAKKHRRTSRKN